jgi:molecular chaperone DnaK
VTPIPLRLKLSYSTEEEFLVRFGPSLSQGGVFVSTKNPKPQGALLAFQFVLADGTTVLAGEGKVVRSTPPGGEGRPGMVLRFIDLDSHSRKLIDRATAVRQGIPEAPRPAQAPLVSTPDAADERRRRRQAIFAAMQVQTSPSGPEPVLGIDLGTTICRAAVHHGGQVKLLPLEGSSTALPAYLALDERGRMLLGTRAKAHQLVDPRSTVFGTKRLLGRRARAPKVREMAARFPYEIGADEEGNATIKLGQSVLSPVEIAAYLLAETRSRASETLGRPVTRAVVCVPAYFNDTQHHAIRQAAQLAGLTVERVLTEPAAVGIAYGHGRGLARKRLLVYDLGGGTFDASAIEVTGDEFTVIAAGGDNFLGGLDFDLRIADRLEERFRETTGGGPVEDPMTRQRIRDAAETAKIALSEKNETRVHVPWVAHHGSAPVDLNIVLDRDTFERLTGDLVERTLFVTQAVLDAKQLHPSAIDEVVLVGGQSLTPLVHASLEAMLGRSVPREVDPQNAVAIGAAIVGRAIRDDDPSVFALRFTEVLSSPIGIALADGRFSKVLDANTPLPCEKTCVLPARPGEGLELAIYQGERALADENEYLGALRLQNEVRTEVNLVFSISRDGVLSLFLRTEEGERIALMLATADAPEEVRREMLAAAPLPDEEPKDKGLFGGIKKLLGRK